MMTTKDFLEKNGFEQKHHCVFANGFCSVGENSSNYVIGTLIDGLGENGFMFSSDLSIYWLIGVLTYYGLIDKNYNQ